MASFGLQPDGHTMILADGTTWDTRNPLPASSVQGFNATPMGSPLNGLGTMAPTAVGPAATGTPPSAYPATPPMPVSPPPTMPAGMFANQSPPASLTVPQLSLPTPNVPKPGFLQPGSTSRKIGDGVSDFILNYAAAQGNPLGTAFLTQQQDARDATTKVSAAQTSKLAALQQFLFEQQYKNGHPEATGTMKNASAMGLVPGTPAYNKFISDATMAPKMVEVPNASGGTDYYDARGAGGGGAPSGPPSQAINALRQDPTLAAQFDAKYGPGASRSVLGQ